MSLESIKANPKLKVLDMITSVKQHGGEVTKQVDVISKGIRQPLENLAKRLAWMEATQEKVHEVLNSGNPVTEEQRAKIAAVQKSYLQIYEIREIVRNAINSLDTPQKALILVGANLSRSADAMQSIAKDQISDVIRENLADVVKKPALVPGLTTEGSKPSPEAAAEAEETADRKASIVDFDDAPAL